MGRARRTRSQNRTHPSGGRYTPPKPDPASLELLEFVMLNGEPIGVVMGFWCDDPECSERHL